MTTNVKIGRLRIRLPADRAVSPEQFAADVARHLVDTRSTWRPGRVDKLRTTITASGGGDDLARSVARNIARAVGTTTGTSADRGGKS